MNLEEKFALAVTQSVSSIFSTLLHMPFSIQAKVATDQVSGDLLGIIHITGLLSGSIAVCLPTELTIKMTEKLMFLTVEERNPLDPLVYETVGEMTNMLVGNIKTALSTDEEDAFELGLPIVLTGSVRSPYHDAHTHNIAIPICVEDETFFVFGIFKQPEEKILNVKGFNHVTHYCS